MADIENLSIQVSSSTDKAINALNQLVSTLQRVKGSTRSFDISNVIDSIKQVRNNASSAATALNRMAAAQERVNRAMGGFTGGNYGSTMRNVERGTDAATGSIGRFMTVLTNAQSAMQRANFGNVFGANRSLFAGQPLLTGNAPIYTEFVDDFNDDMVSVEESVESASNGLHSFSDRLRAVLAPIKTFGAQVISAIATPLKWAVGVIGNFVSGIARIARFRIYRTIIKDLGQSFKDLYGYSSLFGTDFSGSMDKLSSSLTYLRNSIAAMVAPLVNALAPAVEFIIDKFVGLLNIVNQFFAAISGADTYTVAVKVAKTWGSAFDGTSGKLKDTAEDIKRTLLGFDEINKLAKANEGGSGGSGGSSPYSSGYELMFEERPLSSGFKGFSDAIEKALNDTLSRIGLIVSGATLAIGAIMTFSGANVPLGLGLMAAGAVGLASEVFAHWGGINDKVKGVVALIEAAVSGGLAVGAILAFSSGNIPLGIGLMAAALTTGYGAVTISWTALSDKVGGGARAVAVVVAGAAVGVGAVLAFAGHPEIGIPMMVGGLAVGAVALNWDFIKEKLQGPIGAATALISGASLVLGILAIVGGHIPLGIGLILAGIGGLAATVSVNWDDITNWFSDTWEKFKTAAETTWDKLKEIGSGIWGKIKEGISGAVKGVGSWIKEHIFKPFIDAWHWLFGGGDESNLSISVSANAGSVAANAGSVAEELTGTDADTLSQLKGLGAEMGDAIRQGLFDKMNGVSDELWRKVTNGWTEKDDRKLSVAIEPTQTAQGLYESFALGWGMRTLTFALGTNVNADGLYNSFNTAWGRKTRSLLFTIGTVQSADGLYGSFDEAWGRKTRSLLFTVGMAQTAQGLYASFSEAWDRSTRSLLFIPVMTMTANELYTSFQTAWGRLVRSILFTPGVTMSANELYGSYQTAWDRVTRSLLFTPGTILTAEQLYTSFKTAWDRQTRELYVSPKLDVTASVLFTGLLVAWNLLTRKLEVSLKFDITPLALFTGLLLAWNALTRILYVSPKLDNTGAALLSALKKEWDNAKPTLYASPKLDNTGKALWTKFKKEWDNSSPTVTAYVELEKKDWTTVTKYMDDNFGSATGGGGRTSGGGSGRNKYYVSVGLKDPTSSDTTSFWSKLQTAWDSSVVAVNKGLDVIVRPVTSKTKNILSTVFSKIGEWLFGKTDTPTQDVTMNAKAGTGLKLSGTNTYTLSGLDSATVTVNAKPGTGFKNSVSGNGFSSNATSSSFALNEISAATVTVNLKAGNYSDFKTWVTGNYWADINSTVYLQRGNFDYYKTWVTGNYWADINSTVYLQAGNFTSLSSWLGTSVTVSVNLAKGGGTVNSNGYSAWYAADGGVISNNTASRFKGIPRYAGGTSNAHGTLFIAGEAGPEIVGHIGGRTEILNQSQLAQTMFAAVRSAMSGVQIGATFYNGGDGSGGESDYDTMYSAMYDAFTAAMAQSAERDREKLALLRQINEKDFNAEISTSAINRAQQRANRRAGTTIVPVGT